MRLERQLSPLTNWTVETDESGAVTRYYIHRDVEDFDVLYEIRNKGGKWHPRVTADGHVTFRPLRGSDTAEDALAVLLKRCNML